MNAPSPRTRPAETAIDPRHVCPATLGYPLNCWYVAAFSRELDNGLFRRRILNRPVVFYRTAQGQPVALYDRCPHRGLPLSDGALVDDAIQCGYHGMRFGADGGCKLIPSQDSIPSRMAVASYPLVEKWQWIWIWMGDPQKADPALIPDHRKLGLEGPGWHTIARFCMEIKGNYQLLHENLLDTSHITYLHPGTLDNDNAAESTFRVELEDDRVRLVREIDDNPRASFALTFGVDEGVPFHRTLITETSSPNMNVITNIFSYPDRPDMPTKTTISPFGITPASPGVVYHFIVSASSYPRDETPERNQRSWNLFAQDRDAIEAIQRLFDELGPDAPEVSVRADEAALRIRRIFSDMVRAEAQP